MDFTPQNKRKITKWIIGIAGPVGMLISVPVASTVYVLIREATENREKKLQKGEN